METIIKQAKLNQVFIPRKKIGKYQKMDKSYYDLLYKFFEKSPYPTIDELKTLSKETNYSLSKLRFWFKSQRVKDFKTSKKTVKDIKKHHTFSLEGKKLLENTFRNNSEINNEIILELSKKLNSTKEIVKQWFYYRRRKLLHTNVKNVDYEVKPINNIVYEQAKNSQEQILKWINIYNINMMNRINIPFNYIQRIQPCIPAIRYICYPAPINCLNNKMLFSNYGLNL